MNAIFYQNYLAGFIVPNEAVLRAIQKVLFVNFGENKQISLRPLRGSSREPLLQGRVAMLLGLRSRPDRGEPIPLLVSETRFAPMFPLVPILLLGAKRG